MAATEAFVAAYKAGDDDEARALYARRRMHWERIEPVAESFGDLDPKIDLREADLEKGQKWTGWHRIEKDLWPASAKGYTRSRRRSAPSTPTICSRTPRRCTTKTRTVTFTADQIANGARGLLDEVATGKVTGEEEYWSRTDLWDFQANVDGARVGFEGLRPLLQKKNRSSGHRDRRQVRRTAEAARRSRRRLTASSSTTTSARPRSRQLSDAVNALGEPLSQLAAAVV